MSTATEKRKDLIALLTKAKKKKGVHKYVIENLATQISAIDKKIAQEELASEIGKNVSDGLFLTLAPTLKEVSDALNNLSIATKSKNEEEKTERKEEMKTIADSITGLDLKPNVKVEPPKVEVKVDTPKEIEIKQPKWFTALPVIKAIDRFSINVVKKLGEIGSKAFKVKVENPQKTVTIVDKDGKEIDFARFTGYTYEGKKGAYKVGGIGSRNVNLTEGDNTVGKFKVTDDNGVVLELDPLVKSVPTTGTFHHLGHEGKVFIHSDRHNAIADSANFDYMVRIPAGNPNRQVHMRFNFIGKANTGTLDIDVIMYKDSVVSDDGNAEDVVSTNDAVVKTTEVEIFDSPTVTDIGTHVSHTMIVGEKKSASNKEQAVPEWILAPDGNNERLYIFRLTNNSGGTVDVVNALFFYDSEAV